MSPSNTEQACALLETLGAGSALKKHAQLVLEAAAYLLDALARAGIHCDRAYVTSGAILHDAGKILHPQELSADGAAHELTGERLLLGAGVCPRLARCAVTHADWQRADISFEELLIALADHLWKGSRNDALELRVIQCAADASRQDPWALYPLLMDVFDDIAAGSAGRLERSRLCAQRL